MNGSDCTELIKKRREALQAHKRTFDAGKAPVCPFGFCQLGHCATIDIYLTVRDWKHEINPKHSSLFTEVINGVAGV